MSPAIIGLIGVVVGGAITAFAQQLRPNSRSVRGAARLLREELDLTLTYADLVLKAGSWQLSDEAFSNELWLDRRGLLAAELGHRDWISVKGAYQAVERIRTAKLSPNDPLSMAERTPLEGAVDEIKGGCHVLDKLSGPFPTITQAVRRRIHG